MFKGFAVSLTLLLFVATAGTSAGLFQDQGGMLIGNNGVAVWATALRATSMR